MKVLLPSDLDKHGLHLVRNFIKAVLLVPGGIAIHLIDADADLLHTEQVDETRVLSRLALNLARLVVALRNRRREVAVRGDHDESNVSLRGARNHVLDEVTVTRRIDDGVMPPVSEEFFSRAGDSYAALTLL